MNTLTSFLCVGGPLGGKKLAEKAGYGFFVAQVPKDLPRPWEEDFRPNATVAYETTKYRFEVFNTPQGEVRFWVPDGQTPLETMTLLLESYERLAGRDKG